MSQFDPSRPPPALPPGPRRAPRSWTGLWLGLLLIGLGAYFLLNNMGLLAWVKWELVWPVLLILIGLWVIIRRFR